MKIGYKLLVLSAFASFTASAQQGVIWEPAISVADGSIYGNVRPRLALSGGDNPVVLFGTSTGGEIFTARLNGASFDTPVALLPAGETSYHANWTGPDIAAYGNTVVVVYKAQPYSTADVYTVRSTDGGITFSDTIRADSHVDETWMPALTMDDNGNPIVTYMTFNASGGDERIAVAQSLDGGLTYQPQVTATASSPGVACDCCPPEVLSSGNYQMVLYRNNISNIRDGYAALSEDGGATFTSIENMDNLAWNIASCPSTGAHGVILGDSVYFVSASKGVTGKYRVYVSTAGLSGGINLNSVLMMDPPTDGPGDTQNFPRISGANDTLVMVWEERLAGNTNVKIAVTTDGLAESLVTYKSIFNSDESGTQAKPDVIYSNGYVHAVFQDYASGDVIYRRGVIADVAGIEENELSNLTVSPNPAKDIVFVSGIALKDVQSISMVNLLGEAIPCEYEAVNGGVSVDLSQLEATGVYIIEVTSLNGSTYNERIVVQ
ncbi:MAG: hypothetical protein ACI865_000896 [Flavobacteriaceae bacterium]|jgi:hypothetical protein